ncbi:hypothetical protein TI04_00070 [Achromatium sp. WMS2]|nr:hypothetical protein TI04_00070 [Achromatium sp. WMS2]
MFYATPIIFILVLMANWWLPLPATNLDYSVEILDKSGKLLRLYTTKDGYWRLPARLEDLDPHFIELLLSYEDKNFYQHIGVDITAIFRAIGQVLTTGRLVSGASTITMQTVRLLQPRPRTISSKLIEIYNAIRLETALSKQQILALYLTLAPYGGNIQGIRAASLFYFDKDPKFLTLAEIALLIAIPQAPESRRPDRIHKYAISGRAKVLQRLMTSGAISPQDATRTLAIPIPSHRIPTPRLAPHLSDRLRHINPNAQRIATTIDLVLQRKVETILRHRQHQQTPGVTLAAIILDNHTWQVQTYIGSSNFLSKTYPGQINMARAIRSPGSTIKPFIYGLAFDRDLIHPETLIFDRPGPVRNYAPGNFDHRYHGEIRVREALWTSRNIPAIKILNRLGSNYLVSRLNAAGTKLHLPLNRTRPNLAIALGGVGIRMEDLVRLYASLANAGTMRELQFLQSNTNITPETLTHINVLSATATWYVTDILADAQPPTGFTANNRRLAFKTGTSYGFRDAWAMGYDANHTVAVWLGRPDNGYTTNLSGLHSAVPILLEIFALLQPIQLHPLLIPIPPNVLQVQNTELPVKLRHFEIPIIPKFKHLPSSRGPKILYPTPGSTLELASNANTPIHIEVAGGQEPLYLLVNGRPTAAQLQNQTLLWTPNIDGAVNLAVLDAKGHSDHISFHITRLTNP